MKNQITLSTKQQELAFQQIFKISYNQHCADCQSKSPTWASIDFGVFVCYNCSGIHRMLGQNITRIRSTKLDCWTDVNMNIMKQFGNQINNYWEYSLPKEQKANQSFTVEQIKDFIFKKYVDKLWVNTNEVEPKQRLNKPQLTLTFQSDMKKNKSEQFQCQTARNIVKQYAKTTDFDFDANKADNYTQQIQRQILFYQTSEKYQNNPFVKDLINEQKQLIWSKVQK